MTKILSSTGTNNVEVASSAEAKLIQSTLAKYGIKVDVQAAKETENAKA
ncbi:MAG: hypothetical protein K0R18_347 [Bacillales bacterium]|jgi:hypothetical protein|nr:hypothetical protein [Bacillales bacterium]